MFRSIFIAIFTVCLFLTAIPKLWFVFENFSYDVVIISVDSRVIKSEACVNFLESLSPQYPVLLIDNHVLQSIHDEKCESLPTHSIKVAIDKNYLNEETTRKVNNESQFEFIEMDNQTDYLRFETRPIRGIPKSFSSFTIGNILIPSNIPLFLEMWRRSVLLKCLNLQVERNRTESQQPNHGKDAVGKLAELRDILLKFNMISFLNGGTLLGWYRECNIIPHTGDMDIAVFADDFRPELLQYLLSRTSPFKLLRRIGKFNDSFELTLTPKYGHKINTDLFLMYKEVDGNGSVTNWVGGGSLTEKYKYTYPEYDPWCAADLLGYLFWVTCSPRKMLIFEYGKFWYKDLPSSGYNWKKSAQNVQRNGEWRIEELKQVYVVY
ncbi:unnamed protein product [Caenorhabditis brenneri]